MRQKRVLYRKKRKRKEKEGKGKGKERKGKERKVTLKQVETRSSLLEKK